MKKFIYLFLIVVLFSACESNSGLKPKETTIVDIMELYGESKDVIKSKLCNFYIEGDDNSAEWQILKKKDTMTEIHGYECLIVLKFSKSGICTTSTFFTGETRSSDLILDYSTDAIKSHDY